MQCEVESKVQSLLLMANKLHSISLVFISAYYKELQLTLHNNSTQLRVKVNANPMHVHGVNQIDS